MRENFGTLSSTNNSGWLCSKIPGNLTFEIVKDLVDEIVTVSEEELEVAMKDLMQRGKAVVEGAGALATAALLAGKVDKYVQGKK